MTPNPQANTIDNLKAYVLSVKDDDDAGQAIVFAKTAKEAKK